MAETWTLIPHEPLAAQRYNPVADPIAFAAAAEHLKRRQIDRCFEQLETAIPALRGLRSLARHFAIAQAQDDDERAVLMIGDAAAHLRGGRLEDALISLSRANPELADLHHLWERAQRPDAR